TQLLRIAHLLRILQQLWHARARGDSPSLAPLLLERDRLAKVALVLEVNPQVGEVQRAQEARRLAEDRDDSRTRVNLSDPIRGRMGEEIGGRCLSGNLLRGGGLEQREVLGRCHRVASALRGSARAQIARKEARLLQVWHVYLRMLPEHPIQSGRTTLVVADDEEVRPA